jgi:hypothetical protein
MTFMKFAFLIHYLSDETRSLMQLDGGGLLRSHWGVNVLEFCSGLHQTMEAFRRGGGLATSRPPASSMRWPAWCQKPGRGPRGGCTRSR